MKSSKLILLFLLAFSQLAFSQAPANSTQVSGRKPVENYREILAEIPAGLSRSRAEKWTKAQRDVASAALKKVFVETKTPAKFHLKVTDIANWNGMTLYSEVPNEEGYHIRVFGKFTKDWKPQLVTLKKGDSVTLDGTLSHVAFQDVWDQFTLSISLKDCAFTK